MAIPVEIKNGDSLEFYTGIPDRLEPIESPIFSLVGKTWNFLFVVPSNRLSSDYYYGASIQLKNATNAEFRSFQFDFGVGLKDEKNLSLGGGTMKVNTKTISLVFWESSQNNLRSKLPSYYRTGNIIKFTFRFHLPSEPVLHFLFKSRKLLLFLFCGYLMRVFPLLHLLLWIIYMRKIIFIG